MKNYRRDPLILFTTFVFTFEEGRGERSNPTFSLTLVLEVRILDQGETKFYLTEERTVLPVD